MKLEGIPSFLNALLENGGGSIKIPFLLIHKIIPEVLPNASNPWLHPRVVNPKSGGSKLFS